MTRVRAVAVRRVHRRAQTDQLLAVFELNATVQRALRGRM
jgi:hypothetical protein